MDQDPGVRVDLLVSIHAEEEFGRDLTGKQLVEATGQALHDITSNASAAPAIYWDETGLQNDAEAFVRNLLRARGGGVALCLFTPKYFRSSACVAELRAVLEVCQWERHLKPLFVSVGLRPQQLVTLPEVQQLVSGLSGIYAEHRPPIHHISVQTKRETAVKIGDLVQAEWGRQNAPTIFGETTEDSIIALAKYFSEADLPALAFKLGVSPGRDCPNEAVAIFLCSLRRDSSPLKSDNVDILRKVPRVSGYAMNSRNKLFDAVSAYENKWIDSRKWEWKSEELLSLWTKADEDVRNFHREDNVRNERRVSPKIDESLPKRRSVPSRTMIVAVLVCVSVVILPVVLLRTGKISYVRREESGVRSGNGGDGTKAPPSMPAQHSAHTNARHMPLEMVRTMSLVSPIRGESSQQQMGDEAGSDKGGRRDVGEQGGESGGAGSDGMGDSCMGSVTARDKGQGGGDGGPGAEKGRRAMPITHVLDSVLSITFVLGVLLHGQDAGPVGPAYGAAVITWTALPHVLSWTPARAAGAGWGRVLQAGLLAGPFVPGVRAAAEWLGGRRLDSGALAAALVAAGLPPVVRVTGTHLFDLVVGANEPQVVFAAWLVVVLLGTPAVRYLLAEGLDLPHAARLKLAAGAVAVASVGLVVGRCFWGLLEFTLRSTSG